MARRLSVALVAAIALVAGIGAGGAYAYWRTQGSGSGTASVGTPAGVTVVAATATPSGKLIPGGSADLVVQLDNPNTYAVTVVGLSQNGPVTPVNGTGPGTACTSANTGVSVPTVTGLNVTVASGSGIVVHVANGAAMSTASATGCQGASFQIPVTLSVQK
jgi:hypothetical protein